jgi:glucosamine--fructose-6-phosphate aminotransferase (isomerizing)
MAILYEEIKDQYNALSKTVELIDREYADLKAFIDRTDAPIIVYIGCGSSFSVAKSLARVTLLHIKKFAVALAGGDILLHLDRYVNFLENALIVPISRSGSTSEIIMVIEALKARGCKFTSLGITCVSNSKLSKISDMTVKIPWAYDNSVCQTRTVTNLYFAGVYFNALLSENDALITSLEKTIEAGPSYLEKYDEVFKELASKFWTHAVVLADAEIYGIAEEGALAFKEICQLNSNFYHILDSRHGPMVMIEPETLVIIAMSEPDCTFERDLIEDILHQVHVQP